MTKLKSLTRRVFTVRTFASLGFVLCISSAYNTYGLNFGDFDIWGWNGLAIRGHLGEVLIAFAILYHSTRGDGAA